MNLHVLGPSSKPDEPPSCHTGRHTLSPVSTPGTVNTLRRPCGELATASDKHIMWREGAQYGGIPFLSQDREGASLLTLCRPSSGPAEMHSPLWSLMASGRPKMGAER